MLIVTVGMYVLSMASTFVVGPGAPTPLGTISLAGIRIDAPPIVPTPYRVMDDWVLTYVTAGSGSYRYADGRTVSIRPRTVILIPPKVRHWYGTTGRRPWTETFVVFNGPLFELMLAAFQTDGHVGPRQVRSPASLPALRAIARAPSATRGDTEHRLLALADWLVDVTIDRQDHLTAPIGRAARRLAADTSARLDMHEVAAAAGLAYTTFRRRFNSETGYSPNAYRSQSRLAAVANMLALTDMTHREIARHFGFTDEFHLSRRFKAHFGVSPSEYRHQRRRH